MHAFGDDPFHEHLSQFSSTLPKPKAIVFVSAHSVSSEDIHVLRAAKNRIQHDFMGFPKDLYEIQYECAGDLALSDQVAQLLREASFSVKMDTDAPLDHGIWVPLRSLYPKGDVPVVRVSLPETLIPAQILKLGRTLSKLREQGVMLIGTGGAVHNLRELKWAQKRGEGQEWARQFEEWLVLTLQKKNVDGLLGMEEHPHYFKAHPSSEHILPIFFTVGAALTGDEVQIIHRGIEYDTLSMLTFALNHEQTHSLH